MPSTPCWLGKTESVASFSYVGRRAVLCSFGIPGLLLDMGCLEDWKKVEGCYTDGIVVAEAVKLSLL